MTRTDLITSTCSRVAKKSNGLIRFMYLYSSYLECEKVFAKKDGKEFVIDITNLTNADAIWKIAECVSNLKGETTL